MFTLRNLLARWQLECYSDETLTADEMARRLDWIYDSISGYSQILPSELLDVEVPAPAGDR